MFNIDVVAQFMNFLVGRQSDGLPYLHSCQQLSVHLEKKTPLQTHLNYTGDWP